MSGRGVSGRGAILRMMQGDDETLSSGDTSNPIGQITSDSGLGSNRSAGRGRFLLDTTDVPDDSAKVFAISRSVSALSETASDDCLKLQKPTSGRGKILQFLRDEPTFASTNIPDDKIEQKLEKVTEHAEAMKIEDKEIDVEMVPVIRHGIKG